MTDVTDLTHLRPLRGEGAPRLCRAEVQPTLDPLVLLEPGVRHWGDPEVGGADWTHVVHFGGHEPDRIAHGALVPNPHVGSKP